MPDAECFISKEVYLALDSGVQKVQTTWHRHLGESLLGHITTWQKSRKGSNHMQKRLSSCDASLL
jgi:hypothetical protein